MAEVTPLRRVRCDVETIDSVGAEPARCSAYGMNWFTSTSGRTWWLCDDHYQVFRDGTV